MQGITVIYSSDLLPDDLGMERPAGAPSSLNLLVAALAPHGLALRPGPRDTWLVVASAESNAESPTPPDAPRGPALEPPALEDIIVSASRYAFSRSTGPSSNRVDREQILNSPTLGGDAIRATHGLPGVTSSGLTARVNVRGGGSDEALLFVDGVRLLNPFHLKDFQSLFSSINPEIVDTMSVYTGAYPAEYGDRMSAVIDIETRAPDQYRLHEVGISTLTSSVLSSGQFADGRGGWLTSVRRGNLDLLADLARSEYGRPRYKDLYSKLEYELAPRTTVRGGLLLLSDALAIRDPGIATADAEYSDTYAWAGIDHSTDRIDFDVLLTLTNLSTDRMGEVDDPNGSQGALHDDREYESRALAARVTYEINDANWLRAGVELEDADAWYAFQSNRIDRYPIITPGLSRPPAQIDESVELDGHQYAYYLSYRAKPTSAITTELGIRWDRQNLPDGRQSSPRINVLYDVSERLALRGSWGRYYQAHGMDELQIGDGLTRLYPAQASEHAVIGIEYLLGDSTSIRIEAYRKDFEHLRPRFENLFDRVSLLPELQPDRVMIDSTGGTAKGIEFSVDGQSGPWLWWLNATRSRADDLLAGYRAHRSWEEPWAFKGGFLWSARRWTVSVAATWHAGWPITEPRLTDEGITMGTLNGYRLEEFSSLDVRASKRAPLEHGELEWFVELNNALGSKNPCCLEYQVELDEQSQPISLNVYTDEWLPTIPTFGFVWRLARDKR